MEKITIPTAFNIDLEFESADFLQRVLAWFIDIAIIAAYLIIVYRIVDYYEGDEYYGNNLPLLYNISAWKSIVFVPALMYHLVCELVMNGQTPGKKICRIKVISETGGRPSLYQFLLRWLTRFVDFTFTVTLGAAISYLTNKKNQRLGDMAAGTLVIKTRLLSSLSETIFTELADTYQAKYDRVLQLSDRDMNTIKTILNGYYTGKAGATSLVDRTADTIRAALEIHQWEENVQFLENVLKDYNHLSSKQ